MKPFAGPDCFGFMFEMLVRLTGLNFKTIVHMTVAFLIQVVFGKNNLDRYPYLVKMRLYMVIDFVLFVVICVVMYQLERKHDKSKLMFTCKCQQFCIGFVQ